MILQCGEKERAVVAFADTSVCFEPPSKFSIDGVTEKVKEILRPIPQLPWPNGLLSCFENPGNLAISPINLWRFSAAFCHVQQGGGAEGAGEEVLGPGEYFHISIFLGPGENFQCPWSIFKKAHFQLTKEKGGGVACLLYSVVLSCGFKQYDQKFNLWQILFENIKKMPLRRLATDMQDKHDMPLITADDTVGFFFK